MSSVLCLIQMWTFCVGANAKVDRPRYCVDVGNEEFNCSDNPVDVRNSVDTPKIVHGEVQHISQGVVQRIDGTEAEKTAIRDVIALMDRYFLDELLSKPDYESIRTKCQNNNELCSFWTALGECESNRIFMLSQCAAACRFCLLLHTNIG